MSYPLARETGGGPAQASLLCRSEGIAAVMFKELAMSDGWLSSHRDCAEARGSMPSIVHQFTSLSARCSSR